MVKVNENKNEDLNEHGPQSSVFSDDGSFVVLERTPPQEPNTEFASHVSQQPTLCPALPAYNSNARGLPRQESHVSVYRFLILICTSATVV
jgi:hypothetical protein